jgi:hypothetical protein
MEMNTFYLVWIAAGICMYYSYLLGKNTGHDELRFEIASTIVDIQLEKEKVDRMKQEIQEHQKKILEIRDETTELIEQEKNIT